MHTRIAHILDFRAGKVTEAHLGEDSTVLSDVLRRARAIKATAVGGTPPQVPTKRHRPSKP